MSRVSADKASVMDLLTKGDNCGYCLSCRANIETCISGCFSFLAFGPCRTGFGASTCIRTNFREERAERGQCAGNRHGGLYARQLGTTFPRAALLPARPGVVSSLGPDPLLLRIQPVRHSG